MGGLVGTEVGAKVGAVVGMKVGAEVGLIDSIVAVTGMLYTSPP